MFLYFTPFSIVFVADFEQVNGCLQIYSQQTLLIHSQQTLEKGVVYIQSSLQKQKTERSRSPGSSFFIVSFEHISYL